VLKLTNLYAREETNDENDDRQWEISGDFPEEKK
jgi:hypothetical protein